jgi:hypothetical protein
MESLPATFIELEGLSGVETLRRAVVDRRYGTRTISFNCFDVIIDADAGTVTLEDAIDLDGGRVVISREDLLRELPT